MKYIPFQNYLSALLGNQTQADKIAYNVFYNNLGIMTALKKELTGVRSEREIMTIYRIINSTLC